MKAVVCHSFACLPSVGSKAHDIGTALPRLSVSRFLTRLHQRIDARRPLGTLDFGAAFSALRMTNPQRQPGKPTRKASVMGISSVRDFGGEGLNQ